MKTDEYDDRLLTEYLLGAASEEDIEHLDELSITDDALASRLSAVEHDLVDAYVTGELSGKALERFDSHYLSSPGRQQRVRFAQTFQQLAAEGATRLVESHSKRARTGFFPGFFAMPRLAVGWAVVAASMLMLVAVAYLLRENSRMRTSMVNARAERATLQEGEQELQKQLDQQRSTLADTTKELEGVRQSLAEAEDKLAAGQTTSGMDGKSNLGAVLSFVLLPPTRAAGRLPEFRLQPTAKYVDLQLVLESDDFQAYRASLKDPTSTIWQSRALKPASRGQNKSVSVRLPATSLKPQNYSLELTGIASSGAAEIIGNYSFKVVLQ